MKPPAALGRKEGRIGGTRLFVCDLRQSDNDHSSSRRTRWTIRTASFGQLNVYGGDRQGRISSREVTIVRRVYCHTCCGLTDNRQTCQ